MLDKTRTYIFEAETRCSIQLNYKHGTDEAGFEPAVF